MSKTIGIGIQSFEKLITENCFYIDKTDFIREWWENKDEVTLITRPRRFGKTLNMDMLERFLSIEYAGKGEAFEGLSIWKEEKYRKLQGTCPETDRRAALWGSPGGERNSRGEDPEVWLCL